MKAAASIITHLKMEDYETLDRIIDSITRDFSRNALNTRLKALARTSSNASTICDHILAESLSREDRMKRQKEGYVRGMDDDAPSVITFTTMAATFGLTMFKDLLFGYMDTKASTVMMDIKSLEISRIAASIKPACVCTTRMGKGDYLPLSAP